MLIPMKELNAMTPDIKNSKTSIYYLSEAVIAKRFKSLTDYQKRELLKRF